VNSDVLTIITAVVIAAILLFWLPRLLPGWNAAVRQITKAAAGIRGESGQEIEIRTNDEIRRLAHTFNEMSQKLKTTIAAIVDERSNLATVLTNLTDGVVMTDAEESFY